MPTVPVSVVRIDERRIHQTMDGFGANAWCYPWANDIGWRWDQVAYVFDDIDLRYIRLAPWLKFWEAENDNPDPWVTVPSRFGYAKQITATHDVPFARWLTDRKYELTFGLWDVGDWLAGGQPRRIAPENYPELGESIAAYVAHMKKAGVRMPVIEVQNEPDIEAGIQYKNPDALRRAAHAVLAQLDHHDLSDVRLHGPNTSRPQGTAEWAEVWLSDAKLRARTAALSFHTWWDADRPTYEAIRAVAERYRMPVWATETGYCPLAAGCFDDARGHHLRPKTWATAWDIARSYYRAIAWAGASRLYHWTIIGHDAAMGPHGERYPTLSTLRHFANYIQPNAQRIGTSADPDRAIDTLAFKRPTGEISVIFLNAEAGRVWVKLTAHRPLGRPQRTMTSHADALEVSATFRSDGKDVRILLPARSVTSLSF